MKSMEKMVGTCLLSCASACALDGGTQEDAARTRHLAAAPAPDFGGTYSECDEFAGLGLVALENVASYVPEDYVIIEAVPGQALVVAQAGSCASIAVDGEDSPGIFAQFGVAIAPPDGNTGRNFYQIMFTTNHHSLARHMKKTGALARFSPLLSFDSSASPPFLEVDVPHFPPLAFRLDGPVTPPDPAGPPEPPTVFNYWHQSKHFGNVKQSNTVFGIRFGEGSAVTLTPEGGEMEDIVGGPSLTFPFFSSPEIFDQAVLDVETNVF